MRSLSTLLVTASLLSGCGDGCGDDDEDTSAPDPEVDETTAASPEHEGPDSHGEPGDPQGERMPGVSPEIPDTIRVARIAGSPTADGEPVAAGARLARGVRIETGEGGMVVLDMTLGTRMEINADSRAFLGEESPSQLYLLEGTARGILPPQGGGARPALRLVGPTVTLEIPGSGEAWLVTLPSGDCWVSVLAGRAEVSTGRATDDRDVERRGMRPGRAVVVAGDRIPEPTEGPEHLSEAVVASRQVLAAAAPARRQSQQRALATAASALDEVLGWLAEQEERGARATEEHRAAVAADERERAAELQREIVDYTGHRMRLRRLVLTRWERLSAWASVLEEMEPVTERSERTRRLLGLETGD